jgi:hypothetical protein
MSSIEFKSIQPTIPQLVEIKQPAPLPESRISFAQIKGNVLWIWGVTVEKAKAAFGVIQSLVQRIVAAVREFFAPKPQAVPESMSEKISSKLGTASETPLKEQPKEEIAPPPVLEKREEPVATPPLVEEPPVEAAAVEDPPIEVLSPLTSSPLLVEEPNEKEPPALVLSLPQQPETPEHVGGIWPMLMHYLPGSRRS